MAIKRIGISMKLHKLAIVLWLVVISTISIGMVCNVLAGDMQMIDDSVLGKQMSDPIRLFLKSPKSVIMASAVTIDMEDGKIVAISVQYPETNSIANARACLNELYQVHERASFKMNDKMGLWRNEKDRFSIQLTKSDAGIQMLYVIFASKILGTGR